MLAHVNTWQHGRLPCHQIKCFN